MGLQIGVVGHMWGKVVVLQAMAALLAAIALVAWLANLEVYVVACLVYRVVMPLVVTCCAEVTKLVL